MNMQISNIDVSKHLSIREAARRLLRCKVNKIIVQTDYLEKVDALILDISDLQPGNVIEPEIESTNLNVVELYTPENAEWGTGKNKALDLPKVG